MLNRGEIKIDAIINKKENSERTRGKPKRVETAQRQDKTITNQEKEKKKLQEMISIVNSFKFP